jgi:predicted transcriptional regulator
VASKNVTLTLPDDLVRHARHLAIERGMSLSQLVAQMLADQTGYGHGYEDAMARQRDYMRRGLALSFHGQAPWTRDELHER